VVLGRGKHQEMSREGTSKAGIWHGISKIHFCAVSYHHQEWGAARKAQPPTKCTPMSRMNDQSRNLAWNQRDSFLRSPATIAKKGGAEHLRYPWNPARFKWRAVGKSTLWCARPTNNAFLL
jgi:hypothetical protein